MRRGEAAPKPGPSAPWRQRRLLRGDPDPGRDFAQRGGDRFIAHYNLGNKYRQLERFEEALAEYERSVALNPEYISAQHNLALLSERLPGHRERAIAAWRRVLELGRRAKDAAWSPGQAMTVRR